MRKRGFRCTCGQRNWRNFVAMLNLLVVEGRSLHEAVAEQQTPRNGMKKLLT
jgi:hypothetical protein